VFRLETGSCWGQSVEERQVDVGPKEVAVWHGQPRRSAVRARAWWEATRELLNRGLSASRPRPTKGCALPNWTCGFTLEIQTGATQRTVRGCCNGTREAGLVQDAFRRLKPGGPLGPDQPPRD
jgi:hypothetical protein